MQILCWGAGAAEIAVISAARRPQVSLSQTVLSTLDVEGHARGVRISPSFLVGLALIVAGASIRYKCYNEMGKLFTFEVSLRKGHKLITTGPYSVVRHPGYTGGFLAMAGSVYTYLSPESFQSSRPDPAQEVFILPGLMATRVWVPWYNDGSNVGWCTSRFGGRKSIRTVFPYV